ncbi:hypothetical protein C8J56DRAFT_952942 [Mycena floridula]|nr:hypothetical protein C8J56DRAFT_952942 [Mycena floridula]
MPENCRICGFSDASDSEVSLEADYISPAHLLPFIGSNNPPSHVQEAPFRKMLRERVNDLRDLDERIATMRRDLEMLVRQRANKRREVEEHKSVLHPIRRLPKEIMCEIFLSFVDEDLESQWQEEASSLDALSTIWTLPRVSAHWRSVALSFSRMWSTVRLTTEDFDMSRLLEKLRILGAQFHRSAHHELSISIDSQVNIPASHPLLPVLFSTASRWKEFCINITIPSLESLSPLKGSLPSMTKLHVWALDQSILTTPLSMFEFAPRLTTLVGHPYILCKLQLPFSQILEYGHGDLRCTCLSHALLFSRMSNLQQITTICADDRDFDSSTGVHAENIPTLITLASLRQATLHLDLEYDEDDDDDGEQHKSSDCDLLLRLTLPALRELDIHIHHSVEELQALLRRSQCPLDTLSLYVHGVPDDASISDILKDIPTLTSFALDCTETLTTKFMEVFSQTPTITPSLRCLKLKQSCGFDSTQIVELKASRPLLSVVEIAGVMY